MSSPRAWSLLGEAEWILGDAGAAVRAYGRASLLGAALTEAEITCEPVLDLLDWAADLELPEPLGDWVPVLADLRGLALLGREAHPAPAGAGPARRLAAELGDYRARRAAGVLDDAGRIEAKRRMVRIAPATLKEQLRGI